MDPEAIGRALARQPGVVEVHDLHVWEVTSGFPALAAHVLVAPGDDCHRIRRELQARARRPLRHRATRRCRSTTSAAEQLLEIEPQRGRNSSAVETAPAAGLGHVESA